MTPHEIEAIRARARNAKLDWVLESDEPCLLIDDLLALLAHIESLGVPTRKDGRPDSATSHKTPRKEK